nr:GGDEF domain-containing protein [Cochlodiniinecator piscidefendens]
MLTRLFGALVLTAIFAWYSATKAQELHDRLIKESTIDPLTGCFNRRHLTRFTRQFIPSQSFLILIDVDDFKGVNDTCGHYTGDIVLKAIARLIQEELSESDLLFRIGGEEFLVFESQAISAGTSDLAERIRACIDTTAILPTRHITVSIGETLLSHHETFESALQCADKNLYLSKINGRNRVTRA